MDEILPQYSWIKTKDGKTGRIVEIYSDKPKPIYIVEYEPHSQNEDDAEFLADDDEIAEYRKAL